MQMVRSILPDSQNKSNPDWRKAKHYRDYLKSDDWKRRRKLVIRKGARCARCKTSSDLVAHHLTYARTGYENRSHLMAVCAKCHNEIHAYAKASGLPVIVATAELTDNQPQWLYAKVFGKVKGRKKWKRFLKRRPGYEPPKREHLKNSQTEEHTARLLRDRFV